MIRCFLGKKVGDSLIELDNGDLLSIIPDLLYQRDVWMYFMLKEAYNTRKILRVIVKDIE